MLTGPPSLLAAKTTEQLLAQSSHGPLQRKAFLSHTGQDDSKQFASSSLPGRLESAGIPHFVDYSSLKPGDAWPERLVEEAANSATMVVVLTKAYTRRFW